MEANLIDMDPARELRGRIYIAQLNIARLETSEPESRNSEQQLAIDQAHEMLELLERRAAAAGIAPWSEK